MNDLTQTPEMLIGAMAARAREASALLAQASDADKARGLELAAQALRDHTDAIVRANAQDMDNAAANGLSPSMLDRLRLDRPGSNRPRQAWPRSRSFPIRSAR
jgi:glutamate-5-semialdehyde dehydrogenase